jgi:4-hydroxy-2-oxoheptanedioate aldolase
MTVRERLLAGMLKDLADNYAVTGVKAEFETEGTRTDELRRLKEIAIQSGVNLTLKIGGSCSLRDLCDARVIGVNKIVSPMIETPHALRTFLSNVRTCFSDVERNNMKFMINMETITCAENFERILSAADDAILGGIVIGRSDLIGSMGLSGVDAVNSEKVYAITYKVASCAKKRNIDVVVGGKITERSIPFMTSMVERKLLDRFETRKVVFDAPMFISGKIDGGIQKALEFELEWMKYKREYYSTIAEEDSGRISDLEKRISIKNDER